MIIPTLSLNPIYAAELAMQCLGYIALSNSEARS